jgi:hypothetical protein
MPALTRRKNPDRPDRWDVYFGDVRSFLLGQAHVETICRGCPINNFATLSCAVATFFAGSCPSGFKPSNGAFDVVPYEESDKRPRHDGRKACKSGILLGG